MPAASWHLVKLEGQQAAAVSLECVGDTAPMTATLYDSANNVYEVVTACFPINEPDVCVFLDTLDAYAPNDWTTECP